MPTIKLQIKPFRTPNFVIPAQPIGQRQDGFKNAIGIPLADLDAETLNEMCEAFKVELFKKANLTPPKGEQ